MARRSRVFARWKQVSIVCLLLAASLLRPAPARAQDPCVIDQYPAATLLLPYFEVDPSNPSGMTTLFSVNNASASAVLAHVVVWTDFAIPALAFDVYLTGYDVQTFNLRDILINGAIPQTASAGQDPSDTISPQGSLSQDADYASCTGHLPVPPLPAGILASLRAALSGQPAPPDNYCWGQDLGDGRLRGYITVDTVADCSVALPTKPGYFDGGSERIATDQNVLWGDYFYLDPSNHYADGENLVRIKALPGKFTAGQPTFYGPYVGWSAADHRQPLPTTWGTRFLQGGTLAAGTDVVVWVAPGQPTTPSKCGIRPLGLPPSSLYQVIFDEQEEGVVSESSLPATFPPAAANRIQVGGPTLPVPFDFGWLYLNFDLPFPPSLFTQVWVTTILKAQGQFSVGLNATPFDTSCRPITTGLP